MKDSYEQRVQNQFGGFCTKVLKNEVCRILNEYARQRKKVTLWKRKAVQHLKCYTAYPKSKKHPYETLANKGNTVFFTISEDPDQFPPI